MKRCLFAIALSAAAVTTAFAADVDVSISVGHPDYFGRIEIGQFAPPALVYEQAVVVKGVQRHTEVEPIYVRVPAKQVRNWPRYCERYDACGRPVYFVKDEWYRNVYAKHYREEHSGHQMEATR